MKALQSLGRYEFFALSDVGRVRGNNEDAYAVDEALGVAVLADGMGGYNAGEVASALATAQVLRDLRQVLSQAATGLGDVVGAIRSSVANANKAIFEAAAQDPRCAGMGTTVVVAVTHPEGVTLGHVGDSRAYCLRQGVLKQLTRDHSMLQEQVDAGLLTPQQAAQAPGRNLLTRALGVEPEVPVEIHDHAVQAGDTFLLCSDGLTDMLDDVAIAAAMQAAPTLTAMGMDLITRANARGGRDNVTVVLFRPRVQERAQRWWARWF
ncbi:MAG: Stp1/IreP family PP2C-type Ser/Thr phosphatase [Rhodoferax sp.]